MVNTCLKTRKNIFVDLVSYGIYSAHSVSNLYVKRSVTKIKMRYAEQPRTYLENMYTLLE